MKITLGREGLDKTHQDEFPEKTTCCHCSGESRIGFVAHEYIEEDDCEGPFVCNLHKNKGKGDFWLHDCCAVAVYFCKDCLNVTALYNQS